MGNRVVANKLSFGVFGKPPATDKDTPSVGYAGSYKWLVSLTLTLGANVVIALLIKRYPGYEHGFTVWQLALFLLARPRLGWIFLLLAAFFDIETSQLDVRHERSQSSRQLDDRPNRYDNPWMSSALSGFVAELVLLGFTAWTMGSITHFGLKEVVYGNIEQLTPNAKLKAGFLMLAASMYWLFCAFCAVMMGIVLSCCITRKSIFRIATIILPWLLLPTLWLASWLFMVAFIRLGPQLYVLPSLFFVT
jgi:hypothetical protein